MDTDQIGLFFQKIYPIQICVPDTKDASLHGIF
jgi:hypothetical protein